MPAPENSISPSLMLKFLAHPVVRGISLLLVVVGIVGLIAGGLGLAGIGVGLSLLAAKAVMGVSAGLAVTGAGLSIAGFFASSALAKQEMEHAASMSP